MLLEGTYYCCNDSHGTTRVDTKSVKIPWLEEILIEDLVILNTVIWKELG